MIVGVIVKLVWFCQSCTNTVFKTPLYTRDIVRWPHSNWVLEVFKVDSFQPVDFHLLLCHGSDVKDPGP